MKRKILYLFLSTTIILCNISFNCFAADAYFAGVNKAIGMNNEEQIDCGKTVEKIYKVVSLWSNASCLPDYHPIGSWLKDDIDSPLTYLCAHGTVDSLTFRHGGMVLDSDGNNCYDYNHSSGLLKNAKKENYINLSNYNFKNNKILYLQACESYALAKTANENGNSNCAIGFTQKIPTPFSNYYAEKFFMGLAAFDKTVEEAKEYADSFREDGLYSNSTTTQNKTCSSVIYGNRYTKIPNSSYTKSTNKNLVNSYNPIEYAIAKRYSLEEERKKILNIESTEYNTNEFSKSKDEVVKELVLAEKMRASIYKVNEPIEYNFDGNTNGIQEYIKNNIDSNFEISKYRIKMWSDEESKEFKQTLITFMYCLDGKITGVGYRAYVEDGKLKIIYADGVPVYTDDETIATLTTDNEYEYLKEIAISKSIWANENFDVENQYLIEKTDKDLNKYIVITTNFVNKDTNDTAIDIYLCDLNGNEIMVDYDTEPLLTEFLENNHKYDNYLE